MNGEGDLCLTKSSSNYCNYISLPTAKEKVHVSVKQRQKLASEHLTKKVSSMVGAAGVSASTLYRIKRHGAEILSLKLGKDVKRKAKSMGRSGRTAILPNQDDIVTLMAYVRASCKVLTAMHVTIFIKRKFRAWAQAYVDWRVTVGRVDRHDRALLDLCRTFMASKGYAQCRTSKSTHTRAELVRIKADFAQKFWSANFTRPEGNRNI